MGDRVRVAVRVHKTVIPFLLKETQTSKLSELSDVIGADETNEDDESVEFVGYEINYAEWDCLEDILINNKFEYDKEWSAGGEFSEGVAYHRQQGTKKWLWVELYNEQKYLVDELEKLLEEKDVRKAIQKKINSLVPIPQTDLKDIRSNAEKFITDIPEE